MRAEDFFLLINEIDDALVLEAPPERAIASKRFPFGGVIAAVACFAALVAGIFIIIGIRMNGVFEPSTPRNCPDAVSVSSSSNASSSSFTASAISQTDSYSEPVEPPIFFKDPQPEDIVYDVEHNVSYVKNQLLISAALAAPEGEIERLVEELGAEIVGYIELTKDYQIEFRTDKTLPELEAAADYLNSFSFVQGVTLNMVYEINYND